MSSKQYDLSPLCMRARSFVQQGRMEDALDIYDDILKIDPEFALAYADRATAFAMMKQYDAAMADLKRAFALGYTESSAYSTAGTICMQTQQYEQGLGYYTKAVDADPTYPFTYFNRANLYATIGLKDVALADLDKCLSFGGAEDFKQLVLKRIADVRAA